jgi:outer membrane immunogenic protein
MRMFRKICYALIATAMTGTVSFAADYTPPSHNWSGPYVGVHAGAVFGSFNNNFSVGPGPTSNFGGPSGGILAGYNWQRDNLVFGLEADLSVMDIRARAAGVGKFRENFGFSFRGRIGMVMEQYLVFVTAGWAFTDKYFKLAGGASDHKLGDGFTAGLGIEGAANALFNLGPNWTKRLEYIYTNVEKDVQTVGGVPTVSGSDNHAIRATLNYHF